MGKRQRRKVIEGIVTCEKTCIDIGGWVWILLLLRCSKVCLAKTQTDQLTGEKDDKSSHCCNYDPTSKAGLLLARMCTNQASSDAYNWCKSRPLLVPVIGAGLLVLVAGRYKIHHWCCPRAIAKSCWSGG